jgi:hypothetical protein
MEKPSADSASPLEPDADVFLSSDDGSAIGFIELGGIIGPDRDRFSVQSDFTTLNTALDIRKFWCESTRAIKIA